jgi:hypothetical protein
MERWLDKDGGVPAYGEISYDWYGNVGDTLI